MLFKFCTPVQSAPRASIKKGSNQIDSNRSDTIQSSRKTNELWTQTRSLNGARSSNHEKLEHDQIPNPKRLLRAVDSNSPFGGARNSNQGKSKIQNASKLASIHNYSTHCQVSKRRIPKIRPVANIEPYLEAIRRKQFTRVE